MSGNYFWVFVALIAVGLMLTLFGGKKQPGAKDFPPSVQWGALFVVIGAFGVLSEYISLTAVLLLFVVITGLISALDRWVLAPRRKAGLPGASPTETSAPIPVEVTPSANLLVDYSRGFFPVILVVFLLRSFLVEPFTIPSSSMRPGLVVGDFILVNKFIYGIRVPVLNNVLIPVGQVERGDVMVFNFPMNPKVNYIKRVIGLPGDTVEYRGKRLTVNGQAIPDVKDGTYDYLEQGVATIHNDRYRETLLSGKQVDVLNIPEAPTLVPSQVMDFPDRDQCRYDDNGFVCKVPSGKYFMMGDNRDNSLDGRYWGFVDDRLVVGKAFFIWMNFSQPSRIGSRVR
ncbi:signal peptidase I [Paludibacterium purpuratum]|uniref:Signal peptidase I n=1 Tax=Paludibacterium purpuratum TaxID=1144873 RepID=A0A4R7B7X7_9NEIS|nr:signal peptidase I [Paludibacterium purpuratum]TDR79875.1 signal peptidase I [Paludibacterium purpuratum]